VKEPAQPRRKKLVHVTPLRYPGGKGKLAPFVKRLLEVNDLLDGQYVEPYAGGAAIGLELLLDGYVSRIYINDISRPIYAFWQSVLNQTEELARLVRNTRLTVRSWDRQKKVFANQDDHDDLRLGFATFFLNRTNRSGILNGGIIGGRDQTGPWKIDARYNAMELCARIESIARMGRRISISRGDALAFLRERIGELPEKTLIYLDPPYYVKGKDLYDDFYGEDDHATIARLVQEKIMRQKWIVSYDNVKPVRNLYAGSAGVSYGLGYSALEAREGAEVMFFSPGLRVPPLMGAMFTRRGASRSVPAVRPTRIR
jgi:DNA adenine methylase